MKPSNNLLVVDDNPAALRATVRVLTRAGYEVQSAADGSEALRKIHETPPALVLLDVVLPDISGPEVLRRVRADRTLDGVSVVMLSAQQVSPEHQASGLDEGADGYIVRPIANAELIARVRLHLRQRDLTARLHASESSLRRTFANAATGISVSSLEGRFVECNLAYCRMLGYTPEELLQLDIDSVTHPADRAQSKILLRELIEGQRENYVIEKRYLAKSGEVIWSRVSVALQRDAVGAATGTVAVAEDITEQKRTAETLHRKQALLRIAGKAAHLGGWAYDPTGQRLEWSDETCEIHGLPLGHQPTLEQAIEFYPAEKRQWVREHLENCLRDGCPFDFEVELVNTQGKPLWVRVIGEAVRDERGNIVRIQGAFQDITERKRAEKLVRESEERFRQILQSVPTVAIQGYALDGTVQYWNAASERFYGYRAEEALGRNLFDLIIPPELRAKTAEILQSAAEEGIDIPHGELRLLRKNGTRIPVYSSHTVVRREGYEPEFFCIDIDLSERVESEEKLRQKDALLRIGGRIARVGGWAVETCQQTVSWSDEMFEILQLPPGDAPSLGDQLAMYLEPGRNALTVALERCANDGTPFDLEVEMLTGQGRRVWVRVCGEAERNAQGKIKRVEGALQDITALREAEQSLATSRRRFRQLAEAMPFMVWTADTDGKVDYSNRQFFLYTGVPQTEPAGSRWQDCLHPDDRPRCFELWDACVRDNHPFEIEYRLRRGSDKEYRWFLVQAVPIRDETGRVTSWYGTAIDIDETKRLEQEAIELAQRLTATLESIKDSFFTLDRQWRFTYVNSETEHVLQRRRRDLLGATLWEVFPEAVGSSFEREYRRASEEGVTVSFEEYFPPLEKWFEVRVYPSEQGLAAHVRDITEARRNREALRQSEERFRELAETIQEVFWITDPLQNRILYISPAYEKIWGRSRANLDDYLQCWTEAIHFDDRARVLEAIETKQKTGEYDEAYRIIRTDGQVRWIHDRAFPVRDAVGTVVRIVGTAEDITDRRELEEQFRQSQKMEAIGRLAGGVAHDFNNLLTIISGYSELLLSLPDVAPAVREFVEPISTAGERAAALTRQLLGFSRQTMLQPKVLDLNQVIIETGKMLRRLIGEDILFTTVLAPKISPIKVDPGQLDQVLINLSVNARDAMPKGGSLTITTDNTVLGDDHSVAHLDCKPGRYVVLTIIDNGCGMRPDILARIFEPFFTTKEVGQGTGLGLPMVFGIVRQSGGAIHVDSEPGKGSTFKIYLPAADDPPSQPGETGSRIGLRGTETILLVEDDEGVRGLALMSLEVHGYQVLTAVDGKDALQVVERHQGPLDLILTDVVMPNASGPEFVEALKPKMPDVKVLFMSGYTDDAVLRSGLLRADVSFIQKPYSPVGLARKVREVLDEHRPPHGCSAPQG